MRPARRGLRRSAAALALAFALAPAAAGGEDELEALAVRISDLVDAHRRERGLAPLARSDALAELAREHSRAMAAGRRSFGHDGFRKRTERAARTIPLSGAAENVARNTRPLDEVAEVTLARWLASRPHRKNLEGRFDLTGVGVARAKDGEVFVTQLFVARR